MLRLNLVSSLGGHDRKRRRKLIIRFVAMSLTALFIAQVVPTVADQSGKLDEITSEASPIPSEPASDTPTATASSSSDAELNSTATPSASPSASPTPSPTPTIDPPKALESQGMKIQLSSRVSVDPRAQVVRMPAISVSGPEYILICIRSQTSVFDILEKGIPNNVRATNLYLDGDLTSSVKLAGPTTLVNSVFNSQGGAKVSSLGGFLANRVVEISFVATDALALDSSLCTKVVPGNKRVILLSPLALGMDLKKGEVRLEK